MFAGGRLCPMVGRSPLWPSAVGYFKEHRSPCRREAKAGAMEANSRRGSGRRGACRAVVTLLVSLLCCVGLTGCESLEKCELWGQISAGVTWLDDFLWGAPLLILLGGAHIFLTLRLRFIQRYIPLGIKLSLTPDKESKGEISQFGALAIALAATIGTGNIIGVATAIKNGGPGAVFWCWLFGVFGIATKYAEALLSVKYRVQDAEGRTHGGPMYVIERGMRCRWLAVVFAVVTIIASFGIGCMTQSNAVASSVNQTYGVAPMTTGLIEMILIAMVVLGGINVISRACSFLVPFMALLYVVGCVAVLVLCRGTVGAAVGLILSEAFSTRAITGGFMGTAMMMALRFGVARGLFSNESGLGSAPIVAANAKTRNSVRQALISSTGTFWDTVIICALTGIAVVSAGLKMAPDYDFRAIENASVLTGQAFAMIPDVGRHVLTIALVVFAYTTILGWYCYASQAFHYLGGKRLMLVFRIIFVILIFVGTCVKLDTVWTISDIANGLMALPNLVSLIALSSVIVAETRKYLWQGSVDEIDPDCLITNTGVTNDFEGDTISGKNCD